MTSTPIISATSTKRRPFVGLRPYDEIDSDLFFGRENEATLLVNKILTTPLTTIFAASGVGKSSLLRTSVIPQLRQLECCVVYFDEWREEPTAALTDKVHKATKGKLKVDATADLVQLARATDEQLTESLVLVLDQFEQYFLWHADKTRQFGQALGDLLRSVPDAHVVIAVRDEFLGKLYAFRDHFLTISQSRYRLEALSGQGLVDALEKPVRKFEGTIDGGLITQLTSDLRTAEIADGGADAVASTEQVSLPVLQIVCSRMWDVASGARVNQEDPSGTDRASILPPPADQRLSAVSTPAELRPAGRPALSKPLYDWLGGHTGIVQGYVGLAMQDLDERGRLLTAKLLNLLAPRAGIKMAYPVEVLARQLDMHRTEVDSLVRRLDDQRIVEYRDNGKVVELTHDAFTQVLRRFIDTELEKEKEREYAEKLKQRWLQGATATLVVLTLLVLGVSLGTYWNDYQSARTRRNTLIEALNRADCKQLLPAVRAVRDRADAKPSIADSLLSKSDMGHLVAELQAAGARVPICEAPLRNGVLIGDARGAKSMKLVYHQDEGDDPLDEERVRDVWRRLSRQYAREKQQRMPSNVELEASSTIAKDTFAIKVGERVLLRKAIKPQDERLGLIAMNSPDDIEAELNAVSGAANLRIQLLGGLTREQLFVGFAERWSAPLWHVAEERASRSANTGRAPFSLQVIAPREAALAFNAFVTVVDSPELYVTPAMVERLLRRNELEHPCSTTAALNRLQSPAAPDAKSEKFSASREVGGTPRERLVSRVQAALIEAAPSHAPTATLLAGIVDRIADLGTNDPEAAPDRLALWVLGGRSSTQAPAQPALAGGDDWECRNDSFKDIDGGDDNTDVELAEPRFVQVELGKNLRKLFLRGSEPGAALSSATYELRARLFEQHGVMPPEIRYRSGLLKDDAYSIRARGMFKVSSGEAHDVGDVVEHLRQILVNNRETWITSDDINLREPLKSWLRQRFSRNDVKLLLRASFRSAEPGMDALVHDRSWLLSSLVFGSAYCEIQPSKPEMKTAQLGACLSKFLQSTRTTAFNPLAAVSGELQRGVQALAELRLDDAASEFSSALRRDRTPHVADAFVAAYAQQTATVQKKSVGSRLCGLDDLAELGESDDARIELERLKSCPEVMRDEPLFKRLSLCALLRRRTTLDSGATMTTFDEFLTAHYEYRGQWSNSERFALGQRLLKESYRHRGANSAAANAVVARELLFDAFRSDRRQADPAFLSMLSTCKHTGQDECLWRLSEIASDANVKLKASTLWRLKVDLATLATSDRPEQLKELRALTERIKLKVSANGEWSRLIKALADADIASFEVNLARHGEGDPNAIVDKAKALTERIKTIHIGGDDLAWLRWRAIALQRIGLELADREIEAQNLVEAEIDAAKLAQGMGTQIFWLKMRASHLEEATHDVDQLLLDPYQRDDARWLSAIGHLLMNGPDYDRSARQLLRWGNHAEADIVRLLLFWRLSQAEEGAKARDVLEERLLAIPDKESESSRAAAGSLDPWRERIIRYYLNPQNEELRRAVLDPVKDREAFSNSPMSKVSLNFNGVRCEALLYDGLLQSIIGDEVDRHARFTTALEKVSKEPCSQSIERDVAVWLLKRDSPQLGLGH
jgi:hypothetical protein